MRRLRNSLLFLFLAAWLAGAIAGDADKFFDPNLGDLADELRAARQAGKQGVLLMFEMEGCPYCKRMREQILSREDVQAYFHKRFSLFSIDALGNQPLSDFWGGQTNEKAFTRTLGIHGTPSFVIFGTDGREVVRMTGPAKDADEFLRFGRYVADGHYRTQSPEQFYPNARSWKKP
ncbi:MAG: thioredoxin family protein [Ignavibacteria bacterium]